MTTARYGTILLVIYLVFYGGFMLLNTFQPEVMDVVPLAGVNLAVWYGFALIAAAMALALVYVWLCARAEPPTAPPRNTPPHNAEERP